MINMHFIFKVKPIELSLKSLSSKLSVIGDLMGAAGGVLLLTTTIKVKRKNDEYIKRLDKELDKIDKELPGLMKDAIDAKFAEVCDQELSTDEREMFDMDKDINPDPDLDTTDLKDTVKKPTRQTKTNKK